MVGVFADNINYAKFGDGIFNGFIFYGKGCQFWPVPQENQLVVLTAVLALRYVLLVMTCTSRYSMKYLKKESKASLNISTLAHEL